MKKPKGILVWILALLLGSVALSGCTFAGEEDGRLTLAMSGEDREDLESLVVSFSEVSVRKSGGGSDAQTGVAWRAVGQAPGNETGNDTSETGNETNETDDAPEGNETAGNETGEQVTICHVPPGDPSNAHTIQINESAVDAHMAHGDTTGACPDDGNTTAPTDTVDTDADVFVMVAQNVEVDLLAEEDQNDLVDEADMEQGDFDQIVLEVESARAVLTDGTEVDVELETTIVVVDRQFRIIEDEITRVVIDFNLGEGLQGGGAAQDVGGDAPPTDGGDGGDVTVNVQFRLNLIVQNVVVVEPSDQGTTSPSPTETGGFDTGDGGDTAVTVQSQVNVLVRSTQVQFEEVESLRVTFDAVEVHLECPDDATQDGTDGETTNGPDNGTGNETGNQTGNETGNATGDGAAACGWIRVEVDTTEIDLLRFTEEGSFAVLGLGEIESGQVTQIRLGVTSATVVTTDGEQTVQIVEPEADAQEEFEVPEDQTVQVTLVLDLATSLQQQDGQWTLDPTIGQTVVETTAEPAEEDQPDA